MEVSFVRRQLAGAIERARRAAQDRRQLTAEAEKGYEAFLAEVATPVVRQLANVLKVDGYPFAVSTPGGSVRLDSDHGRSDYLELGLDTTGPRPEVVVRRSRTRGSRLLADEHPVKPGAAPQDISEEEVLSFLLKMLEPWLER